MTLQRKPKETYGNFDIAETQYETVNNTNCTWICPKCEFCNFSDSFFGEQVNLGTEIGLFL